MDIEYRRKRWSDEWRERWAPLVLASTALKASAVAVGSIWLASIASRALYGPPSLNPRPLPPPTPAAQSSRVSSDRYSTDLVVSFPHPQSLDASVARVGGKGYSLLYMANRAINVPPGFILTTEFFVPWELQVHQVPEWAEFLTAASAHTAAPTAATTEALKLICARLKDACARTLSLSPSMRSSLDSALALASARGSTAAVASAPAALFAVRSSSPQEDLEGASFAGGYETVLGVSPANLDSAIIQCYVSCLDVRVVLYKLAHNFAPTAPTLAVVVQAQINSRVSGVAFSINPINNDMDEVIITSNYGLGETVVSGQVSPDEFLVRKGAPPQILQRTLGKKETVMWLNTNGYTTQSTPSADKSAEFSLPDPKVIEVTRQCMLIEELYGKPIDIEFGLGSAGEVFVLQARPVTTGLPLPPALLTTPNEPRRLYFDGTLGVQGFMKPMSIAGADFVATVAGAFEKYLGIGPGSPLLESFFKCRPEIGRILLDITSTSVVGIKDGFLGVVGDVDTLSYKALQEALATTTPAGGGDSPYLPPFQFGPLRKLRIAFSVLTHRPLTLLNAVRTFRQIHADPTVAHLAVLEAFSAFLASFHTDSEPIEVSFREFVEQQLEKGLQIIAKVAPCIPRFRQASWRLQALLAPLREADAEVSKTLDRLMIQVEKSLPGNVTVEMGLALDDLATDLRRTRGLAIPTFEAFASQMEAKSLPRPILARWADILAMYGHRGDKELDLKSPRFRDNPNILLKQVYGQYKGDPSKSARKLFEKSVAEREAAWKELEALLRTKLSAKDFKEFKDSYEVVVKIGGFRETPKFCIIKILDAVRGRFLEEGTKLVASGRLDKLEQVFDLTLDDMARGIENPTADLRAVRTDRRKLWDRWAAAPELPRIFDSRGRIWRPKPAEAKEGELVGTPVSAGVVRAKVKILATPDEKPLHPGEILVATATDPGWTPLFLNASGIILEVGGVLQHGALVAREYGKPCVVGIQNATTLLRDGQIVEIDGGLGVIKTDVKDE